MHPLAMTLAINIRRARNRLRMTTEEVAKAVHLTVEEYERIERGNFPPTPTIFLDIVTTLCVPADQLLIALEPPNLYIVPKDKSEDSTPSPPSPPKPPWRPGR